MFSLNRAMVIGNLTRDPEIRYTPNGQSVASFSVATNRRWKGQNGEIQDDTQYHEIVAWGKLGEIAAQTLKKGKRAYVEGRLQTRSWEAPDGSKRQRTEIIAENLIALSPKSEGSFETSPDFLGGDTTSAPSPRKTSKSPSVPTSNEKSAKNDSGDDLFENDNEIKLEDIPF